MRTRFAPTQCDKQKASGKTALNGFGFGRGCIYERSVFCELFLYKPTRWHSLNGLPAGCRGSHHSSEETTEPSSDKSCPLSIAISLSTTGFFLREFKPAKYLALMCNFKTYTSNHCRGEPAKLIFAASKHDPHAKQHDRNQGNCFIEVGNVDRQQIWNT